jgi:hypothetical protein
MEIWMKNKQLQKVKTNEKNVRLKIKLLLQNQDLKLLCPFLIETLIDMNYCISTNILSK